MLARNKTCDTSLEKKHVWSCTFYRQTKGRATLLNTSLVTSSLSLGFPGCWHPSDRHPVIRQTDTLSLALTTVPGNLNSKWSVWGVIGKYVLEIIHIQVKDCLQCLNSVVVSVLRLSCNIADDIRFCLQLVVLGLVTCSSFSFFVTPSWYLHDMHVDIHFRL